MFGNPYGGGYGRRRRSGLGGDSLLDEVLLLDEIEDLEDGDFEGALEDEILRDFF